MKMRVIAQLTSIQILLIGIQSSDVRLPPTITKNPAEYKVFRSDEEISLECEASGNPTPQYEWFKNDVILSIPGISGNLYQGKQGALIIKPATSLDEGYYQCRAFNQYGTSVSKVSYLRRAVLEHFVGSTVETFESDFVEEGQPFSFDCNKAKVFPRPSFSWALAKKDVDSGTAAPQDGSQGTPVQPSKRIQVDEHGNLHFAYVIMADAPKDMVYKCNMYNPHLDVMMGGSYSRLRVKPKTKPGKMDAPPVIKFPSYSSIVALEGRNISLRCFFSGYPEPTISWTRHGRLIASDRHGIGNYNTELTIRKVNVSDKGPYLCTAANSNGTSFYSIDVVVQAAPVFRSMHDQPHNKNVTEGSSVIIFCRAYADPSASVVWYRNGKIINFDDHPKYHLSEDGQKLKISDLCKDCTDSSSDLTVIQCNASNVHGYAFADGYINILKKTSIIIRPEDIKVREGTMSAQFDCMAQSDDSTPVTINWYRVEKTDAAVEVRIHNSSRGIYIGYDSSLHFRVDNFTEWIGFVGLYRCEAKNGYSIDSANVVLVADNLELPPAPPLTTAGLGDLWWIFLIVALILLLLILLTCCCICLQQNKGDSYPVDEKERNNGNNPEKELAEGAFHDYQRPEGEPLKGSRASLSSSIKIESEEEASLSEYGDIDAGKFTEDGSFIGDYGVDKKRANPNAKTEKA